MLNIETRICADESENKVVIMYEIKIGFVCSKDLSPIRKGKFIN